MKKKAWRRYPSSYSIRLACGLYGKSMGLRNKQQQGQQDEARGLHGVCDVLFLDLSMAQDWRARETTAFVDLADTRERDCNGFLRQ